MTRAAPPALDRLRRIGTAILLKGTGGDEWTPDDIRPSAVHDCQEAGGIRWMPWKHRRGAGHVVQAQKGASDSRRARVDPRERASAFTSDPKPRPVHSTRRTAASRRNDRGPETVRGDRDRRGANANMPLSRRRQSGAPLRDSRSAAPRCRSRPEKVPMRGELIAQLDVVVDLAVEGHDQPPSLGRHRLLPRAKSMMESRQCPEDERPVVPEGALVGPAMADEIDEPSPEIDVRALVAE